MGASLHKQLKSPEFQSGSLDQYDIKTLKKERLTCADVTKILKLEKIIINI